MKITKIEKVVMGVIVFLFVAIIGSCSYTFHVINEAGGMKQVIIDTGKEMKEISREISKDT